MNYFRSRRAISDFQLFEKLARWELVQKLARRLEADDARDFIAGWSPGPWRYTVPDTIAQRLVDILNDPVDAAVAIGLEA